MEIFGIVLLAAGAVLWFVRGQQERRCKHLQLARATHIGELKSVAAAVAQEIGGGDWRDYVVLWGTVETDQPITSPMKSMPCVYYSNQVVREYEETIHEKDKDGNTTTRTQRGSDIISQEEQQIPFHLIDSSSERVLVNPDGADLAPVEILNEFRPGDPAGGMASYGSYSRVISSPHQNFHGQSNHRRTLGYRYRESVIPVGRSLTVVGMVSDRLGSLTIEQPKDNQPFIISPQSQESLTKAALQNARIAFWSMVGCLVGEASCCWAA